MQKIPRFLAGLMGVFLALPFALQWVFAPEATSATLGISLDGFDPQVEVAMGVETLIAGVTFATARQFRSTAEADAT